MWRPLNENILDSLGHELLEAVRRRGVRRLVIDALGGFERAAVQKERLVEFFATLTNELRALGVTAIATWEMRDLFGHDLHAPYAGNIQHPRQPDGPSVAASAVEIQAGPVCSEDPRLRCRACDARSHIQHTRAEDICRRAERRASIRTCFPSRPKDFDPMSVPDRSEASGCL